MNDNLLIAITSPILVTLGALITWFVKSKREGLLLIEEKAREKRLETYRKLLEPFIIITTPTATKSEQEKALSSMSSVVYKKAAFDLITFGSDKTVRTYNKMMHHFFTNNEDSMTSIKLYAEFILCIRKDLYSNKTKLKRAEVLEFTITDMDKHRDFFNSK